MLIKNEKVFTFENGQLNTSEWGHEIGYIRNHELQYYSDSAENCHIENNILVLEAVKTGNPEMPFTSASINTYGKYEFLYGTIEMEARLPYGTGIWPAFWTLGVNIEETGWPDCGEIDIMELIGGRGCDNNGRGDYEYMATVHYPGEEQFSDPVRSFVTPEKGKFSEDFHFIGMHWTPDKIEFTLDGKVWKETNISHVESLHNPHFILLNLAVGGDWPGDPDEHTVFPQRYEIKQIRYVPLKKDLK